MQQNVALKNKQLNYSRLMVLDGLITLEKFDIEKRLELENQKGGAALLENLMSIEVANTRIDDGYYGICLNCEREIDYKILLSNPTQNLCSACLL